MNPVAEPFALGGVAICIFEGALSALRSLWRAAKRLPHALSVLAAAVTLAWDRAAARTAHRATRKPSAPAPAVPGPGWLPAPMPDDPAESMLPFGEDTATGLAPVRAYVGQARGWE